MLPTWTPSPTPPLIPSPTPRPTFTSQPTAASPGSPLAGVFTTPLVLDRPTYATLARPTRLISLEYDPLSWALHTTYPASFMAYGFTHRLIYNCKLEPVIPGDAGSYLVESYSHPLGATTFEIDRLSQDGVLAFATYCTGDGEDRTCYRLTPGDNHATCQQDAEAVLSTFRLDTNTFLDPLLAAPNQWLCQDQADVEGRCTVSYSVPLNTLAYTANGDGWAAGDDGRLYQLSGTQWSEVASPSSHAIYDMSFSSPTDGWAVGEGAQVLHWDGIAWSEVLPYHAPGEGPGGSTQVLYGVLAVAADDAWMVGMVKGLDLKNRPYALHWDGTDLIEHTDFPDCACGVNAVLALGQDNVLAVGTSSLGAITFHWDGAQWQSTLIQGADWLYTVQQTADGSVWAAGIEYARDRSSTRGALFRWDGQIWQRIALPPLMGGVYQLSILPEGQVVLGGDFSALWTGSEWQPIMASLSGYGWIVDLDMDLQGVVWALTRSGNLFRLETGD
jgi:photosystem II stability/assembly factor-like uncharacterized protein